jgi:hypothetical protein
MTNREYLQKFFERLYKVYDNDVCPVAALCYESKQECPKDVICPLGTIYHEGSIDVQDFVINEDW